MARWNFSEGGLAQVADLLLRCRVSGKQRVKDFRISEFGRDPNLPFEMRFDCVEGQ